MTKHTENDETLLFNQERGYFFFSATQAELQDELDVEYGGVMQHHYAMIDGEKRRFTEFSKHNDPTNNFKDYIPLGYGVAYSYRNIKP